MEKELELVRRLFQIDLTEINTEQDAIDFSQKNMLHEKQIMLNKDALLTMKSQAVRNGIYLISDILMLHIIVFFIGDSFMVLGPYTDRLLSSKDVLSLMHKNNISSIGWHDLFDYHGSFSMLSDDRAIKIVQSLIAVCDLADSNREVHLHKYDIESTEENELHLSSQYDDRINKRYEYERDFIAAIQSGNEAAALHSLNSMQLDVSNLKRIGTTIENERIGAAITRTTARIAAFNAGIPALVADRIANENTRATFNTKNVDELLRSKEQMVTQYCRAVSLAKGSVKSKTVQSAIFFLEQEYSYDIRLDDLVKRLNVSKPKLIADFRRECGTTPIRYLNSIRIEKSKDLLLSSNYTIQQISSHVGIADANYFIKLFKSYVHMTPGEYRNQK